MIHYEKLQIETLLIPKFHFLFLLVSVSFTVVVVIHLFCFLVHWYFFSLPKETTNFFNCLLLSSMMYPLSQSSAGGMNHNENCGKRYTFYIRLAVKEGHNSLVCDTMKNELYRIMILIGPHHGLTGLGLVRKKLLWNTLSSF